MTHQLNIISGETKYVENTANKFLAENPHFKVTATSTHNITKTIKTKARPAKGNKPAVPASTKKIDTTILTLTLTHETP